MNTDLTHPDRRIPFREDPGILPVVLLGAAQIFIVWVLSDWDQCWIMPEVFQQHIPHILSNGTDITLADVTSRVLSYDTIMAQDGVFRLRLGSYMAEMVNDKLRVAWAAHFIPHPSLSWVWLLSLVVGPLLLYRFAARYTGRKGTALACTALYCTSTAVLGQSSMIFHLGKPLANFLAIFCLWLAMGIRPFSRPDAPFAGADTARLAGLVLALTAAFLTEEVAWFIPVSIVILFPGIFRLGLSRTAAVLAALAVPAALFLLMALVIAPMVVDNPDHPFVYFVYSSGAGSIFDHLLNLRVLTNLLINLHYLVSTNAFPFHQTTLDHFLLHSLPQYMAWGVALAWLARRPDPSRRRAMLLAGLAAMAFAAFHTGLMNFHSPVTDANYYYGSLFPLYFFLAASIALTGHTDARRLAASALLILLLCANMTNFTRINMAWRCGNPGCFSPTRDFVAEVWADRHDRAAFEAHLADSPWELRWVFMEIAASNGWPLPDAERKTQ